MRLPLIARSVLSLLIALLWSALVACAGETEPEIALSADRERTDVDSEIQEVYAAFTRAYRQADVQMLMDSVYGDSAFYLPPRSPVLRGQDQFRGQFSFLETYGREGGPGPDISFEILDRDYSGDLAYDIGVYTIRAPRAPDDTEATRGKFVVIWKRGEDGLWRIHADAFSPLD